LVRKKLSIKSKDWLKDFIAFKPIANLSEQFNSTNCSIILLGKEVFEGKTLNRKVLQAK
jgi:hypothetical protein